MKFIEKLNNTGKILLLVLYVIVLALILLLAVSLRKDISVYDNYGTTPGDENIDISVRIKERRNPSTSDTEKETQYWDMQVYLHMKDQEAIYRNVTVYTAILKKDGSMKYEEKTASILTGIENPSNVTGSVSDRSIFSSYSTTSKTMVYNSSTEEYTKKDGEPDKVYVKVVYEIRNESGENNKKEFTYQCDIINEDEIDFNSFEKTTIEETTSNIDTKLESNVVDVKVRTELNEEISKNDTYRLNVKYNPLGEDDEKVVESASVVVYLGMNNPASDEEEYFSNYIDLAQYHGSLPYLYTIPQVATAYSGEFEINDLYVYTVLTNTDGTNETSKVTISVPELPKY